MNIKYSEIAPGDRLRVKWIDSHSSSSTDWLTGEEFDKLGTGGLVVTEATVYKKVKKGLLLYNHKAEEQYGGCWFVPAICINKTEIERLG